MFGFSIFLNQSLDVQTRLYVQQMAEAGFSGIFTSLHIPEDDQTQYRERLIALGQLAQEHQLDVMVDISGQALENIGFDMARLDELRRYGINGLRMDDAIDMPQIALVSQAMNVSLNASTLTREEVEVLKANDANFENIQAWHNYYPRPETGLDEQLFKQKNQILKQLGIAIVAFVPGDDNLRGPLFSGLPTLERDRYQHPLASALALLIECQVSGVYIGDGGLSMAVRDQFAHWIHEQVITLHATKVSPNYFHLVTRQHRNRQDAARDVLRSAESRLWQLPNIIPGPMFERRLGAITIDNQHYQRYMGEIQVMRRDLPNDEKTNVVGYVTAVDLPLINQIGPGQVFEIVAQQGENENERN
ncbi:DUF871 domain-containing protein [Weissella diestrammenae]|uniref:DUF871 domain-containing protein n=1 Tax=Weissella diestrammenae TaxID=1162633 RepID=UPI001961D8CB|nr:MupG family TIM beta-alpha barrel fold protein [Weissella diestrammenae]MCM0582655.1 DUF871 domain-containing protein [Weissella diestrammenae]